MPETWGLLPKSQVDDELIEEAIARLILEHNEDETAHLGTGQSLQSHKASEIIDHVVASIVADKIKNGEVTVDKLNWDRNLITTEFESLDGWKQGGVGTETITVILGGTKLETGANNGDTAYIACVPAYGFGENPNFDKKPYLQVRAKVMDFGYAETHIHIGYYGFQAAAHDYIGFRIDQNKIYAVCRKSADSETAVDITGSLSAEDSHDYAVEYVSSTSVKFYIDGTLKTTITTNIPTGGNEEACIFLGVRNSHNGGEQTIGVFRAIYKE